jgi:hypothetical protein
MSNSPLPAGFESLAPFVAHWAKDTTELRLKARAEASMDENRAFYAAMLPLAEQAINHLETFDLHGLPAAEASLAMLVLALAQAAVAVEMHGEPISPGTPYPNAVRVLQGAAPFG